MNNKILKYLDSFRRIKAFSDFKISLMRINLLFLSIIFILIIIESLFYLEIRNRYALVTYTLSMYLIINCFIGLKYYFNYKNLFDNNSNESIAELIGTRFSNIKDKLINVYQLESSLNSNNKIEYELSIHAINKVKTQLNNLAISFNKREIKSFLKKFYIAIGLIGITIILFSNSTLPALNRLMNPQKKFEVPLPFILTNVTKNEIILNGESQKISIAVYGEEIPNEIILNYIIDNQKKITRIGPPDKEIFNFTFNNIQSDIIWWGSVHANSFFSPWDNIQSQLDTIRIIKRPIISNLNFEIIPPVYTGLESYRHPANMSNINLPYASEILITGNSDKNINKAAMLINDEEFLFEINETNFIGNIILMESCRGSITCRDESFNRSSSPIFYNFNISSDMPPLLSIISPDYEFDLDETDNIDLNIQISDDYGISQLWIEYIIKKPSYIKVQDTTMYTYNLNELNKKNKVQNIHHQWNIGNINFSPEDEIHFTINIIDNNSFTPSTTTSKIFIGKYPTLEDLFEQMNTYEENIYDQNEDIMADINEVQELLEELELDLLKSDELGWEEKQDINQTVEEMEQIFNQIEELQKVVEKIEEQAEKNNLINDDLMQKYDEFQNLLNEIITPELLDAMEKMQKLSETMNLEQLLDELNNFEYNLEIFEEQLDRFIDMFEQALAEQKIDEVIKKLESMLSEQINIINELNKENINLIDLSSKERKIEEDYNNLQNVMQEAQNSSEKLSQSTSKMFDELMNSNLNKTTSENIQNSRKALQNEQKQSSEEKTENSKNNLTDMLEEVKKIQENFQDETVNEMMNEFFTVVNSILNISKYQDELSLSSEGVRSNSPILPDIAKKQNKIKLQNEQLMKQILLLSRKTFYITPPIIRALGKSSLAMDRSIGYLEQKKSSKALREQVNIISGLNQTAYLLLNSMEEMMSSGSASGFESFMKQLEQLSNQQEGVNQSTMQLPQLGMGSQKSMMQQLMEQQQALKEGLQQLMGDMPGSENTGLGEAAKEMEDVINDFKRNQIDRMTKEKQQRILSRMLDSQKSLTQKDFSKKRKSESPPENILYDSVNGLPDDKGERELLLINAMESALQEGHSNEYQEIIKLYFYNLQNDEDE